MTIKIEDLTPGTRVRLREGTVKATDHPFLSIHLDGSQGTNAIEPGSIEAIISRPETAADKIARLERELAERDDRINELVAKLTTRPNPLIGEPTCYDDDTPTTPVWSDPIEGPPPKGLPAGSYAVKFSEHGGWTEGGTPSDGIYKSTGIRHRIAMHQPIQWEGGERPVPGGWVVTVTLATGEVQTDVADSFVWDHPTDEPHRIVSFTLTSTGGK